MHGRLHHHIPLFGHGKCAQLLADALGKRIAAKQEKRHVGAQTNADFH